MNLTPWERYFSFLLSGVLSVKSMHRKSGQQCVLQRLLCTVLGDGRSQEHFSFSWVFVCTGFLWYLLGDTLPSITRPRDLPQDSLFLHHRVFKVILRPLPIVTCSLKNIPPQRVCDVYNRENGGYVHTEGSSSHGIFNPKARGKYHNSPRTMSFHILQGIQRNPCETPLIYSTLHLNCGVSHILLLSTKWQHMWLQ